MMLGQRTTASLWFVPSLFVLGAFVLSGVMLAIDGRAGPALGGKTWWLFNGTADGARTILSVVAGSLITVVAVAFSVTMIAIQQASTQFTPRILRNFTRDRGNQVVLGTYIATFVYALLVLRQVRSETTGAEFVPTLSIFTAIVLALVSLGLLIYFIHHSSEQMQVSHLLTRIREELDHELNEMFPTTFGSASRAAASPDALLAQYAARRNGRVLEIRSADEGYLRRIDERALTGCLAGAASFTSIEVEIGLYVHRGQPLARCWTARADDEFEERIRDAFVLDRERSTDQDPRFAFKQLVDIALKALSPGVNDPTTAEQAMDHLVGGLCLLAQREFPHPVRELEGGGILLMRAPSFTDYVDGAFDQIRRAASSQLHVLLYLMRGLATLGLRADEPTRRAAVRRQLSETLEMVEWAKLTKREQELVRSQAEAVFEALHGRILERSPRAPGAGDGQAADR